MRSLVSSLTLLVCLTAGLSAGQSAKQVPPPANLKMPHTTAVRQSFVIRSVVLKRGTGKVHPKPTDMVTVNYTGWTTDGKTFDSAESSTFPLNEVITGWTEGLQLMVTGEKRRFWIPEQLAYRGRREPYGTLVFDIELISIGQ
jgi:FKBP-type peptidyl-prolyl cis-trans isomerase